MRVTVVIQSVRDSVSLRERMTYRDAMHLKNLCDISKGRKMRQDERECDKRVSLLNVLYKPKNQNICVGKC